MKELLLAFIFALIIGSIINGWNQFDLSFNNKHQEALAEKAAQIPNQPVEMTNISEATFESEVLKSSQPVLVEFGAKWCTPCQMMKPVLEQLASEYSGKLKICSVDVDENEGLSEEYAQGGLPTLVVFTNGQAREVLVGFTPKENLAAILKAYIG